MSFYIFLFTSIRHQYSIIILSQPKQCLCSPVVHYCCAAMFCNIAVQDCCAAMLFSVAVHDCCAELLGSITVLFCCAGLLYSHSVQPCQAVLPSNLQYKCAVTIIGDMNNSLIQQTFTMVSHGMATLFI